MGNLLSQSIFIPAPALTEKNVPDQTGKIHIVTGGYAGCGAELCKILYGANATVYVAGRSDQKASRAIASIKSAHPNSTGKIEFLSLDLADLKTIKPAVDAFLSKESRLDVLTNNAGVMFPPKGSKDAQGYELQMGTNCLGHFLLTELLKPTLIETAKTSEEGLVRVTWAGSLAVDVFSPKPGGIDFDDQVELGKPKILNQQANYGQSKAGNLLLANEAAKRWGIQNGVVHLAWNPGNLKTELQRHVSLSSILIGWILYPAIYGAYTELFAALSTSISPSQNGAYIHPWGRIGGFRNDIAEGLKSKEDGGTGVAAKFWDWCDNTTKPFC